MQEELLISLLNKEITHLQEKIEKEAQKTKSLIEENKELIESIREDKNNIIYVDLDLIKRILQELQVKEYKKIVEYIETIQKLLILNKEEHTTYKLTESQLNYINMFLKEVDNYEKKRKIYRNQMINDIAEYQQLLHKLNHNELITELNTIKHLFKELSIDDDTQRRIIFSLMKHNRNIEGLEDDSIPTWDI